MKSSNKRILEAYKEELRGEIEDKIAISLGVYRTEKECTQAFEKQKAHKNLWKNADKKYFFRPDWGNALQAKYALKYDHIKQTWSFDKWLIIQQSFSLPYFATKEDTQNFIKENEKDLEIYRLSSLPAMRGTAAGG